MVIDKVLYLLEQKKSKNNDYIDYINSNRDKYVHIYICLTKTDFFKKTVKKIPFQW